jgi:hypothetical protein
LTATATAATGIGLFWTKYLITSDDPWAVINHPLQPWLLKAHILVVPALVFVLGLIATRHIWPHAKAGLRYGLRSGIITTLVTVPMIVSGYLIQVITQPGWLTGIAIVHIATGFLFTIGFAAHRLRVRFRQRTGSRTTEYLATAQMQQATVAASSDSLSEWKGHGGPKEAGSRRGNGYVS